MNTINQHLQTMESSKSASHELKELADAMLNDGLLPDGMTVIFDGVDGSQHHVLALIEEGLVLSRRVSPDRINASLKIRRTTGTVEPGDSEAWLEFDPEHGNGVEGFETLAVDGRKRTLPLGPITRGFVIDTFLQSLKKQ